MTVGKATILEELPFGRMRIRVTDGRCIAISCERPIAGTFTVKRGRPEPDFFDDVKCPHCGTRNYAKVEL